MGFRVRVRVIVCVLYEVRRKQESLFLFRFEFYFVTLRAANLLANYKIISYTICCYQPMRRCSEFEHGDGHCAIMRERFQCITNTHRKFQLHPPRVYSPIYCVDKIQERRKAAAQIRMIIPEYFLRFTFCNMKFAKFVCLLNCASSWSSNESHSLNRPIHVEVSRAHTKCINSTCFHVWEKVK